MSVPKMHPKRSLIICTTPRSGSTLLCDLVAQTGIAGNPASYFRRQSLKNWCERLGLSEDEVNDDGDFSAQYLDGVMRRGQSDNGTFAERLMFDHFVLLLAGLRKLQSGEIANAVSERSLIENTFGPAHFIFLSREDKVEQAVSRLRAEQSGRWHELADGSVREQVGELKPITYDADAIAQYVREQILDEQKWQNWFLAQNISPLIIKYEALNAAPKLELVRLLEAVDLDPEAIQSAVRQVQIKSRRLADDESAEWVRRFRAENELTELN